MRKRKRNHNSLAMPDQSEVKDFLETFSKTHTEPLYCKSKELTEVLMKIDTGHDIPQDTWKKVAMVYRDLSNLLSSPKKIPSSLSDYLLSSFSKEAENNILSFKIHLMGNKYVPDDGGIYFSNPQKALRWAQTYFRFLPSPDFSEFSANQIVEVTLNCMMSLKKDHNPTEIESYNREFKGEFLTKDKIIPFLFDCYYFSEVHELLSKITDKNSDWKEDIDFLPAEDQITHQDLMNTTKDTQFWDKVHEFDPALCALVDLYKNDVKEYRESMLADINSRTNWKKFFNTQNDEFTIGKLEYLLKRNSGKEFEINIGKGRDEAPKYKTRGESFQTIWKAYQQAVENPLDLPRELTQSLVEIKCTGDIWKPGHYNLNLSFTVGNSLYDFDSQSYNFSGHVNLEKLFEFIKKTANHEDYILSGIIRFFD
jgi:hypothetical protein